MSRTAENTLLGVALGAGFFGLAGAVVGTVVPWSDAATLAVAGAAGGALLLGASAYIGTQLGEGLAEAAGFEEEP